MGGIYWAGRGNIIVGQKYDMVYNSYMQNRLYLDNCSFNRPYDNQSPIKNYLEAEAELYIQKEILQKKFELAWSYIMDYEISFNPFSDRRAQILKWKNAAVINIDESKNITVLANDILKKDIKPKGSLHIACAIEAECNFFITTDRKILGKSINGIIITDPIDFIKIMEV